MSTYKGAGVDIEAGDQLIGRIKGWVKDTATAGSIGSIGAFGGFFRPDFRSMKDPVLVSSVDGVGTKLKVAFAAGVHHSVGQCLVNHCVNDILVCGAHPLFFLDYYATGKLNVDTAAEVIRGFTIACKENNCALVGGETAEMPGLYQGEEYDLSGTIIGMVDRANILDGSRVKAGDRLLGLPSTGLHTNGYSLARKILLEEGGPGLDHQLSNGQSIAEALLAVHRSYLHPVKALQDAGIHISAMSHITGGGIFGNTTRVLPAELELDLDRSAWTEPEIFTLIRERGHVADNEMLKAFNLGIGLIIIVAPDQEERALELFKERQEVVYQIGQVVSKAGRSES